MKKIIILINILIVMVSCNDLNISPTNSIVQSSFYKTELDVTTAVNGVYYTLTYNGSHPLYGDLLFFLVDLGSDYARAGNNTNMMSIKSLGTLQYDPSNDRIDLAWSNLYQGIDRANLAIDKIPNSTASDVLKARLINESKFLRALFYFNAVQLWGPIPLVLHEGEGTNATRTPVDSVYLQITKDLKDALNLPASYSGSDVGRATNGAANALLSKVYLTWAQTSTLDQTDKYDKAVLYANQVINGGYGYKLLENFLDIWDITKKNGKEHIFTAQFALGGCTNTMCHCTFATGLSNAEPVAWVSDNSYYNIFDNRDQRKAGSFAKTLYNPSNGTTFTFDVPRFRKYIDTTHVLTSTSRRDIDVPIIRYADVLLFKAEALNERYHGPTAEAYEAINEIRRRAYKQFPVTSPSTYDFSELSYEQFRDTLRQERYFEFVEEQQRWFDLVRWKILVKTISKNPLKSAVSKRNYLFPIPQSQREINPTGLWQNWGYDGATVPDPYDVSYQ